MKKFLIFFDRYYILFYMLMGILITWLNFFGATMISVYGYYIDFKNIILAGFDPKASIIGAPTFPMWGYGWLLLITENKIILIFIQFVLAIFSLWYSFKVLSQYNVISKTGMRVLKIVLLIALPWFAFHSIRWPYSISMSLITLSVFMLWELLFFKSLTNRKDIGKLLLSGVLFGLALNFRSDYYLAPLGIFIVLIIINIHSFRKMAWSFFWVFSVYLLLVPWGLYTKHATGHFLLTSTNAGHVFFIGLGNLPGNTWGIIPLDQDPRLAELIEDHYGEPKTTLIYETDSLIKKEFSRLIRNNPKEYLRKCSYSFGKMIVSGVYPGEFLLKERQKIQALDAWIQPGDTWTPEGSDYPRRLFLKSKFNEEPFHIFKYITFTEFLRLTIKKISYSIGILLTLISFVFLPIGIFFALRKRIFILFFLQLIILYQMAINVAAYNWYLYTSNIFLYLLINLIFSLVMIYEFLNKKREIKKTKS
ncbi:MAG: hypothetical protein JXJ22_16135 [Bacteroidales bacterium]|nr:hypothetical protein [Bacteroidales bacterium]